VKQPEYRRGRKRDVRKSKTKIEKKGGEVDKTKREIR